MSSACLITNEFNTNCPCKSALPVVIFLHGIIKCYRIILYCIFLLNFHHYKSLLFQTDGHKIVRLRLMVTWLWYQDWWSHDCETETDGHMTETETDSHMTVRVRLMVTWLWDWDWWSHDCENETDGPMTVKLMVAWLWDSRPMVT